MGDEAAHALDGDDNPSRSLSLSHAADAPSTMPPSRGWLSGMRRPRTSPGPRASPSPFKRTLLADDDARRDSALAPSNSTSSTHHTAPDDSESPTSLRRTPSLPAIVIQDDHASPQSSDHTSRHSQGQDHLQAEHEDSLFQGIDTIIPTGDFDDLTSPSQVSFSKRGSMLLGGKRAAKMSKTLGLVAEGETDTPPPPPSKEKEKEKELCAPATPRLSPRPSSRISAGRRAVSNRVLSIDEAMLSRKVRSMYMHGNEDAADWGGPEEEDESMPTSFVDSSVTGTPANGSSLTVDRTREDASSLMSARRVSAIVKEPTETAGGAEDWADIEGGEVDRYGFIIPRSPHGHNRPDEPRIQRVSTALQLASEEPRKRGIGRSVSKMRSMRSLKTGSPMRRRSQRTARPEASIFSSQTTNTRNTAQTSFRHAANRLPHNKDRRLLDEASDMLKLPPGLADIAEQQEGGRAAQAMKAKEMEREEKWRKMAKVVRSSTKGGGMMFEFDTTDSQLIARTWKGIPDRWRATAWYAFLAVSARAVKDSPTDEELVEAFYELQEESSADDMQIDVDVPRTINRHIMFRRRYRGGFVQPALLSMYGG
jgi:hypothetical protein